MMRRCVVGTPSAMVCALTPFPLSGSSSKLNTSGQCRSSSSQPTPAAGAASPKDLSKALGVPDFGNADVYKSVSFGALCRGLVVFRMCRSKFCVYQGPKILKKAAQLFGNGLAYGTLCKVTMFDHFCAGTDEASILPALRRLESVKVGAILDYAAEAEVPLFEHQSALKRDLDMKSLIRRVDLKYKPEAEFDGNLKTFVKCIDSARADFPMEKVCFSAVKLTGLVDPQVLARVASLMLTIRQEWVRLFTNDTDPQHLEDCRVVVGVHTNSRFATKEQMLKGLDLIWKGKEDPQQETLKRERFVSYLVKQGQTHGNDQLPGSKNEFDVDYLVFTNEMCKALTTGVVPFEVQPMVDTMPALTDEELTLIQNCKARCDTVMKRAIEKNVFVMVDAEQTFYQMAIDHFVREMQRTYNRGERPFVYNTYQCYLKIAEQRVENDLQRADREGWKFAGKMVRGAYVEQETATALEYKYANPIHPNVEATHDAYNKCAMKLVERLADKTKPRTGVLFGTHNLYSLQLITSTLYEKVPRRADRDALDIAFGQLYGMTDYLTLPLARSGYRAFKYVPYGPVPETVEYLSRRAQENGAVAGATLVDTRLIWAEMKMRPQFWIILLAVMTMLNYYVCFVLLPEIEAQDPDRPSMLSREELGFKEVPAGSKLVLKNQDAK